VKLIAKRRRKKRLGLAYTRVTSLRNRQNAITLFRNRKSKEKSDPVLGFDSNHVGILDRTRREMRVYSVERTRPGKCAPAGAFTANLYRGSLAAELALYRHITLLIRAVENFGRRPKVYAEIFEAVSAIVRDE
jgi:hypothetical protein